MLLAAGANALIYDALTQGLSGLEALAADPLVRVPVLAATHGVAVLCGAANHGIGWTVVLGTLLGHSRADMVLYPGRATGGPIDARSEASVRARLRALGVWPAPVSGPGIDGPVRGWADGADVVLPASLSRPTAAKSPARRRAT